MTFQEFSGLEYLKIDIANNFGLDKEDWDVRIAWFDENEHQLDALIKQAEEPALYFAGLGAYRAYIDGKPSGYPIALDATSSGIQLLACLTGDRKAASLCNVVDTGHREDAYVKLYEAMLVKVGEGAKIERKATKQAIMTAFYSSTAVPKQVFGEGALLDIFYETMAEEAPGAWETTQAMLDIWDPTALINEWVMPDNFHVKVKVMGNTTEYVHFLNQPFEVNYSVNQPIENGRSLGANTTHSLDGMVVREMTRRCDYDVNQVNKITELLQQGKAGTATTRDNDKIVKALAAHFKDSGFLSARVLQYIDAANIGHIPARALAKLIDSLPAKPFQVLSVHDCFRCLPNYGNDLRRQYNIILAEIAESELLSFMISQIVGRVVTVDKIDRHLHTDILDANYALS
jgi:hypothetical protein